MSAIALAPKDIAGPSASSGRKIPSATPRHADAEQDFTAALAQIAEAAPAQISDAASGTVQQPASANGASTKTDAAIWKELSAFSGAKEPVADGKADTAWGLTGAAASAKPLARPDRAGILVARETAPAETRFSRRSALTSVAALDLPAIMGNFSAEADGAAKPSHRGQASPAAPKTEDPVSAPAAPAANSDLSVLDTASALLLAPVSLTSAAAPSVPAPADRSPQSVGAGGDDKGATPDAVARIGATLLGVGGAPAPDDAVAKPEPQASPSEQAIVSVHAVSQKTWLPPVSAGPNVDMLRLSQDAAAPTPRAAVEKFAQAGTTSVPVGEARDTSVASPPADAQSDAPLGLAAVALPTRPAPVADDGAKPAAKTTTGAAPPSVPSASAPAPRRDLEITLTPKDLGGLEVRMKSSGDRLELAFVADRGETARMISDKSGTLESQLHGAGLGLGGIDISSASLGRGGGRETQPQQQPQAWGGGGSDQPPQSRTPSGRNRQEPSDGAHDQTADPRARGDRGLFL